MAKTPKQRQAEYRENLRLSGRTTVTITVTSDAAELLRQLAREHGKSQGEVVALGVLLARQRLRAPGAAMALRPKPSSAPAQRPRSRAEERAAMLVKAIPAVAREGASEADAGALPAIPEPARQVPAWYPDNYAEMLREGRVDE